MTSPVAQCASVPDSGLLCLVMLARYHGLAADPEQLRHEFAEQAFCGETIQLAARRVGLKVRRHRPAPARLPRAPLPAIALDRQGGYFVLARFESGADQAVLIQRPGQAPARLGQAEFEALWAGELLLCACAASPTQALARFDFSWFIPALVKHRHLIGEVLLISLVLQFIALLTPLFFQVVMDKVLVNNAMETLNVIAVGFLAAILFEALLTGIRTYLFAHTSSKLDVELGARLYAHLLRLPLAYFQARRVGDSVARVRELENIRAFLTGNAVTVLLDVVFSVVFIAVMFFYSVKLTLVVLAALPCYFLLSLVLTPVLRRRLDVKFNRGAENQAFLVETVSGIDTVKSLAVEPQWQRHWDRQLAGYVVAGLSVANVAMLANTGVTLISRLVALGVLWVGATEVVAQRMTVGELVAFNMLSGHVTQPVIRLAQLWNDFQQTGVSMQRLGDILNCRTEVAGDKAQLPALRGSIELDRVSFRYRPDAADALRNVSLRIAPGEVVGVVGRSGSGKSTLTRLIQRMFVADRGRVLIDGHDIGIVDSASLRRQLGVVLQESTLFNRSVRDNIALTRPGASMHEVVAAARLAGAHEFICQLPEGYDTMLGENGVGLSGGQRQRIGIARALIHRPRVLILDEATSALDYESEHIIQRNMRDICDGRTVIIIAHRLSAVRCADRIVVMEGGEVAECGSHETLLAAGGLYARLQALQAGEAG
ncbi:cyclolysin T1SS permease/ATPase CyaB [Bordetella bronchiseptica]|uniref:cyclolysin T1SS permease/ATPase CyaB n=1 Tax=Bordetella bronchiseptica TaxID=518 RepID=UPI000460B43F|nr:cyclolysin T1SS permease/ATPase CyaB [Bordetella bronchiseptica]AWP78041.1 type I secretion system permease/ATPase [Bordetella bronchiseptica]KAB1448611.1 type I secretion system permease/ATPase [Bordetella bronchiseptica]KAB1574933.1 type I secretion system permease/ATPase [Bordetella bronchiseptica]KDB62821.1 toxin RTX-I translocation ATP-binding protein [Bordetella bronchiseptica B18-5 (C3)]KDC38003.1 toxin RTX-I translocation ATP-binding protein [Bordetella bronchiseptica M435/02/3]